MSVEKIIESWCKASRTLHLTIQYPFTIQINHELISYPLLIKYFGCIKGTIIFDLEYNRNRKELTSLKELGYHYSFLGSDYQNYERDLFIDTLEDWGYFGKAEFRPNWYQGKYYQQK